ncbi:hypothetical protein GCM10010530_57250 [Kribbella aluminosa]
MQGGRYADHQRHRGGDQEDVVHLVAEALEDDEAEGACAPGSTFWTFGSELNIVRFARCRGNETGTAPG